MSLIRSSLLLYALSALLVLQHSGRKDGDRLALYVRPYRLQSGLKDAKDKGLFVVGSAFLFHGEIQHIDSFLREDEFRCI